jgi:DNA-binding XRE family transcriptional regulator
MTRHTADGGVPHLVIRDARGDPEYAVVPYPEFVRLSRSEEDLRDRQMAEEALTEEELPWLTAKRLLHGESPIKVWREHRGLSQRQLAEAVGVRAAYVSQLETGRKRLSLQMTIALARALSLSVDDLVGEMAD